MRIIAAYGIDTSPLLVSASLYRLKVSHSLITTNGVRVKDQGYPQPGWPVVYPSLDLLLKKQVPRSPQVLLVCDSRAKMSSCNIRVITVDQIPQALIHAVTNPVKNWRLTCREPTLNEYVNLATKPSFLNGIQTAIYRINPYALRKEVQFYCIQYLDSVISSRALMLKLKTNLKLADVAKLMSNDRALALRRAVAAYKKGGVLEEVAAEFGFDNFEISYVTASSRNSKRDRDGKA